MGKDKEKPVLPKEEPIKTRELCNSKVKLFAQEDSKKDKK